MPRPIREQRLIARMCVAWSPPCLTSSSMILNVQADAGSSPTCDASTFRLKACAVRHSSIWVISGAFCGIRLMSLYPPKAGGTSMVPAKCRYCCKSRRSSAQRAKTGNNRIQTAGFVNQYSLFTPHLVKLFFAPRPKIFLQQYRPLADARIARLRVRYRGNSCRDSQ